MTPKDETPAGYFTDLFERARRALTEHIGAEVAVLDPGTPDQAPNSEAAHVAAQLRIDDRTREVIVRFYDVHTGSTIRELPPQLVAAAAARLRLPTV